MFTRLLEKMCEIFDKISHRKKAFSVSFVLAENVVTGGIDMGDYSMPNYFQNMEQVGKELAHIDEENEKLIKDVEEEIGRLVDEIHDAGTPDETKKVR